MEMQNEVVLFSPQRPKNPADLKKKKKNREKQLNMFAQSGDKRRMGNSLVHNSREDIAKC